MIERSKDEMLYRMLHCNTFLYFNLLPSHSFLSPPLYIYAVIHINSMWLPSPPLTDESLDSWRRANECSRYEECVALLCCAVPYLHGELGDPLAAGLSEWAVSIYTVTHIDYMSA